MLELRESFPLDLSEVESTVSLHEIDDSIKLLIYEAGLVANH